MGSSTRLDIRRTASESSPAGYGEWSKAVRYLRRYQRMVRQCGMRFTDVSIEGSGFLVGFNQDVASEIAQRV